MFRKEYKYFNKWFVIGQIQSITDATRQDSSSFGVNVTINTGNPSGYAFVRIPNNKNVPDAYATVNANFNVGSRVKVGFNPAWAKLEEREHNGRTYRQLTQFHLPDLATLDEHNRFAGKLSGELVAKNVVEDTLQIVLLWYNTDKDGGEVLYNDQSQPVTFTLTAHAQVARDLYQVPVGANIEVSARNFNQLITNDYGDVENSVNEVRVEKFTVLAQPQATAPSFAPQPQQPFQQSTPTQQSGFPSFGGQQVPFPNAGGGFPSFPGTGQ